MSENSKSGLVDMAPDPFRGMNPAFVRKVWAKRRAVVATTGLGIVWSDADKELLFRLMAEGVCRKEMARRLGRSLDAVDSAIKRARKENQK